jgi:non-homologous end joining protein Ku
MRVIEEKIADGGKELPPAARRGAPPSTKVVDIVALLQESLKQHGGKDRAQPKTKARKRA